MTERPHRKLPGSARAERAHWWLFAALQLIMSGAVLLALYEGQWMTAAFSLGVILVMFLPSVLARQAKLQIPEEFEMLALLFVFGTLFLGEVLNYYERYWWWDIALHTTSGLLLGMFGFLLVYVLNETERVDLHMRPRFVAMFAFLFAVAVGALWEVFEFGLDRLFDANMQKPMAGDPSGLTDTMWDLIVDTLGALVVSLLGWWHMHTNQRSFIDIWIRKFVIRNPRLFRKRPRARSRK